MVEHAGDKRRRRGRQSDDKTKANKADAPKSKDSGKATQQHTTLLLQLTEDAPKWYLIGKQLPERNDTVKKSDDKTKNDTPNTPAVITKYRQQADDLFRHEIALALSNKSKDDAWMESTMRKGTLKDRIAAMSVVLSQSPVHQFHVLQQLMDMTRPTNNSRVAQLAAEALLDLWMHTYLPSQRPLIALSQRPLMRYHAQQTLSPRLLLLWRFEEMIMEQYLTFLQQYLKYTLQEGLETQKIFALKSAATLLQRIPTGEQILLSLLVNKLGDPARKIAARAAHELRGILYHHPAMQPVVAREVQQTVHRPHLSPKALYHCILFLNQLEFSSRNPQSVALATSLIQTYFQLFEWAISGRTATKDVKKTKAPDDTKLNSRLLSALLTGVNRAHPYVDASHDMEQYLDALYRVVHTAPPAACTQAMLLLFHLVIGVEQKQQQQQEQKQRRNKKNRQAPVAATPQPSTPEHEARRTRFYRALYAKLIDTQLLFSGKHLTQFFNLLYKSFKYDTNERRIQACCKRLMSTILSCPNAATVTATLFLWHEVARIHPFLQQSYARVVPEDSEYILDASKRDPRSALVQMENGMVATAITDSDEVGHVNAPVWEMNLLQHHYHPSVVKFTHSLDSELGYNGDPLHDFAFGNFLDKFAYRNPKTSQRSTEQTRSAVMERHRSSTPTVPVNDRTFLQKNEVSPEDEFFFRFFEERAKRDEVKGIVRYKDTKKGKKDDDDDSQDLLDKIEQNNVDDQYDDDFDAYERAWEDDPEEEAFVDSLAESLMEDTMDMPSDLDDEDPDTEGWDDLHDDDDDQHVAKDSDDDDDEVNPDAKGSENDSSSSPDDNDNVDDDDDAFMDQSDDSDSDAEMPPKLVLEDDEDDEDQKDKSDDEDSFNEGVEEEEDEEDDDAELLFMAGGMDDGDDDDNEDDLEEVASFRSKKKSKFESSVFASAEDYEERIAESFQELRSSMPPIIQHRQDDESIEETATEVKPKLKQNKRKKNKKKR
ncbi:ribosome biogenesis protein MAK21 [Fistulifera solaris]|jgi:ribosome biogenesis protein MAK21|uniref:Ribosome biogenesis protein MAK21 n=1 Tax=Fistulifera solaris TaxID=1519565 RepID=A0A1Z5KHH5_FISSO|nr:ribosome biogenesis protein MAK21 [Fistulifera solaris]|eukprot:GAX25522.1 ribosome biogenesis protein MAK21 [Fistulifera solaris]